MRKVKTIKYLVYLIIFSLSFFFCFSVKADDEPKNEETETSLDINVDTTWHKNDDLTFNKIVYVNPGATLTIEKGSDVKFGELPTGDAGYLSVNGGRVVAEGTGDEPIKITALPAKYPYSLIEFSYNLWEGIPEAEPSFFRYVEISGGGYTQEIGGEVFNIFSKFIPSALAFDDGGPAVYFEGGRVHMENCRFFENKYADVGVEYWEDSDNSGNYLEIVNSNFEKNGDAMAINSDVHCRYAEYYCAEKVLLKNNWYGDSNGPSGDISNVNPDGKKVSGVFNLKGWKKNKLIADPVIIIPGITGSEKVSGIWELDPISHSYDNIYNSFSENGYEKDKNLFAFPYDWKNDGRITVPLLASKIEKIVNDTKISKVDLVAHSMGGLIARGYIEEIVGGVTYGNNVDQFITLGTPHRGAPKAYLQWEAGEGFFSWRDAVAKHHFSMEAKHAGYSDLQKYIQEKVISVRDLLPDYDYLFDVDDNAMRNYSKKYPVNDFLEKLNNAENLKKLKRVYFTSIIGDVGTGDTISKIRVTNSIIDDKWKDGMPEDFYNTDTDQGLEYNNGDGTVPKFSAEGILADKSMEINATHGDLPSEAQCKVIQELSNKQTCFVNNSWHVTNILLINIFSPIDIQVIDKNGKRVGKNFRTGEILNEIPGAYYSGYDTENEFLTIPNPIDGEYKILTQGTGEGEYKIETAKISQDENDQEKTVESVAEITGTAATGAEEEKTVTVENNEVVVGEKDTTPPAISGQATTEPNVNGWYKQDVTIHFDATDESGIASVILDTTLTQEGADQSVIGTAVDMAGNSASFTVKGINIDKSAPNSNAEILGTSGENGWYTGDVSINFASTDTLSGTSQTYHNLDGVEFKTGNDLSISQEGEHLIKYYSEDKAGNKEAEKEMKIKIDKTAPIVKIISPESKTYFNNKIVPIKYQKQDNLTVSENIKTEIFFDDQLIDKNKIDLSLEHLGSHNISIEAKDEAGNSSEKTQVDFESKTDAGTISQNIGHYYDLKLITSFRTKYFLQAKLKTIEGLVDLLGVFDHKWMPRWAKERIVENLKRQINHEISDLENQMERQKNISTTITLKARELLRESLEKIRV